MELTDEQWEVVKAFLPEEEFVTGVRGRPWTDARQVLNGVLWILKTGAQWSELPGKYPPYQTCHRRFQAWIESGALERILEALARDLTDRGGMDIRQSLLDGTFVPAKRGAKKSATPSGARGPRSWQWRTAVVFLSPSGLKVLNRMK